MIKENLDIIEKHQKEIILLSRILNLLEWDQQTYMPKKSANSRAEQMSFLSGLIHEKVTSDELFNAIKNTEGEKLDSRTKIMIRLLSRKVKKERKLPPKFVEELSKATSLGFSKRQEAKQENKYKEIYNF